MAQRHTEMSDYERYSDEYEEIPEEYEETPEEMEDIPEDCEHLIVRPEEAVVEHEEVPDFTAEDLEKQILEDLETPSVEWSKDIEKIEDSAVREEQIEDAREIVKFEEDLKNKRESGEITQKQFEMDHEEDLISKKRRATTRAFLASKGSNSEKYGDMFERLDDHELPLSQRAVKEKNIREVAEEIGEDDIEKFANRLLEEYEISEEKRKAFSKSVENSRK